MKKEIKVSCPECKDQFHTTSKINEMEACTICNEVFIIEESDIV